MTRIPPSPAILLFLKAPIPGEVKTRLARDVGDERACTIYRELVERQIEALPPGWPVEIHFAPASTESLMAEWLGTQFPLFPQSDGDLGRRLRHATTAAFRREHRQVFLVGGDCPTLNATTFTEAAQLMQGEADAVIGPATDGGYYLLGLTRPVDTLFEDIPWSGPEVARLTAERAKVAGLHLRWLEKMEDVDDLAAYRRAVAAGRLSKPLPTPLE